MIEEALLAILKADSAVTTILGTGDAFRMFPNVAPEKVVNPYITTTRVGTDPTNDKDGPSRLDVPQEDIDLWGDDHEELLDLALKVRQALDRTSGTFAGHIVQSIRFVNQIEEDIENEPEQLRYHFTQTYAIRHQNPLT